MKNNQQQLLFISLVIAVLLLYNLNVLPQQSSENVPNYIINNIEIKAENVAQESTLKNQQDGELLEQKKHVNISSKLTKDNGQKVWVTMGMTTVSMSCENKIFLM